MVCVQPYLKLAIAMFKPIGDLTSAKYIFVGGSPSDEEFKLGQPFTGPSNRILLDCLASAGINRADCYFSHIFPFRTKTNRRTKDISDNDDRILWSVKQGLTDRGRMLGYALCEQLEHSTANLIISLGDPATEVLASRRGIGKHRGSTYLSTSASLLGRKVLASHHPASCLQGQALNKYMIIWDFKKAAQEVKFSDLRRPQYQFITQGTYNELMADLQWILKEKPEVSADIEMANGHMSRICFATDHRACTTVPFDANWSLEREANLWLMVAKIIEDPDIPKIYQNGLFDMSVMAQLYGMVPRGHVDDTMIMHRILYTDFPSSLGFLTSLYTRQEYYKDMVHHKAGEVAKSDG